VRRVFEEIRRVVGHLGRREHSACTLAILSSSMPTRLTVDITLYLFVFTGRRGVAVASELAIVAASGSTWELAGEVLSEKVSRVVEERLSLRMSFDFEFELLPELFRDFMLAWETFRRALRMEGIVVNDGGETVVGIGIIVL
jgi:hypothetical protein